MNADLQRSSLALLHRGDWLRLDLLCAAPFETVLGGMGVVYHARHRQLNREVDLKVLSQLALSGPGPLGRVKARRS